jgi:hypothetical protein
MTRDTASLIRQAQWPARLEVQRRSQFDFSYLERRIVLTTSSAKLHSLVKQGAQHLVVQATKVAAISGGAPFKRLKLVVTVSSCRMLRHTFRPFVPELTGANPQ